MVRLHVAAGSTPAFLVRTRLTRRIRASRRTISATAGASSGRAIAASYTIERAPGPTGEPWSERKKLIWWDQAQRKWTGVDVPDFPLEKSPEFRPTGNESGLDGDSRRRAVHLARGRTRLAARAERFAGRTDADALRTARIAGAATRFTRATRTRSSIGSRARKIDSRRRAIRDFHLSSRPIG